jgi:hypothetical protein
MVDVSQPVGFRAAERAASSVPLVSPRRFGRDQVRARRTDFSGAQIAAMFAVLAAICSIPILAYPWPPLGDYINHLSRMHIIATLGSDPDLSRFYQVDWQIIPNLMMDIIVPLLERVMNVYLAGQVYTITSFVLILSGALSLNRALYGRWSVLPLIAFPLLYNNVFLVGTMNYVFGIGLSLWALTAWVWLRRRPLWLRLLVSTAFVLALFICHLFSVGIYALGLFAYELYRLWHVYAERPRAGLLNTIRARGSWPIIDFVAGGLPFLPVLPLLMISPTWSLNPSVTWEFHGKLEGIVYVFQVYSQFAAFVLTGTVAFAAGWAVRHRALKFHTFGWFLLAVGAVTYLAMPRIIFETYMADQRLPISLVFMVIACAHLDLRHDYVRRGFATVLVLLLAIRVFEVQTVWAEMSRTSMSFRDSVRHIDRGAKILVAYADPDGGDDVQDLNLVHAACLAIIERSALVTTAFTVVGKQVLHVREPYRGRVDSHDGTPPTVEQLIDVATEPAAASKGYWRRWTADYDYVYVLFTDPEYENPDPEHLTPIYAGDRFMLYRIHAGQTAHATNAAPGKARPE